VHAAGPEPHERLAAFGKIPRKFFTPFVQRDDGASCRLRTPKPHISKLKHFGRRAFGGRPAGAPKPLVRLDSARDGPLFA
jgi:hypothetical protein